MQALTGEGTRSLSSVREEVEKTLEEARVTLREVRRPLSQVDPAEVAKTVVSTQRAMAALDMRLSSAEVGKAIDNLITTLDQVTQMLQSIDLAVRAGRDDFVATLSDLRQAAEDVREFSRIIAQDPSTLIRGKE
jgi:replicative DNA helicase